VKIETLDELETAFKDWRAAKRHPREAIPAALLERARRAARVHSATAVWRATKVGRDRLGVGREALAKGRRRASGGRKASTQSAPAARRVPSYSRLDIGASSTVGGAFAEVETPLGLKVRFFSQSEAALGLLSSLCSAGGGR